MLCWRVAVVEGVCCVGGWVDVVEGGCLWRRWVTVVELGCMLCWRVADCMVEGEWLWSTVTQNFTSQCC